MKDGQNTLKPVVVTLHNVKKLWRFKVSFFSINLIKISPGLKRGHLTLFLRNT